MEDIKKKALSKNIKALRKRMNLTQEKLADELGYTKQAISNWERGENVPSNEDIEKMAKIFGVEPNVLLGVKPGVNPNKDLDFIEIMPIPGKVFTYALFLKDNVNGLWRAFIYDMDYMAMLYAGYSCTVCDDYVSFKKDFFKTIDENVENVRDYLEAMDLEEEPEFYDRDAKNMIEGHALFATDPERFFREATPLELAERN